MKTLTVLLAFVAVGPTFAELNPLEPPPPPVRTAEQIERIRNRKAKVYAKVGGLVQQEYAGNYIRIVNRQTRLPKDDVANIADSFRRSLGFQVREGEGDRTGFTIVLEDQAGTPALQVFPEVPSTTVNVNPLYADSPDAQKAFARVSKEVWRGTAFAMGAGFSKFEHCNMKPMYSLSDLDREDKLTMVCPEPFQAILETARLRGITPIRRTTYKKACEEGWAPPPTNDIQKAVWDKVHAMPTAPIRIKPETKKVDR